MRSDQSAQIASVDMSGKLDVLKTLTWRDSTQAPSLSPDGRFLAYHNVTDRQSPPDLYILATDGSREQRIEHPARDSQPLFLPDGSGVVFESDRRGILDLWFQAVADGRPSGQPRLVWRGASPFGTAERFADNGSLFYFFATNDYGTYTVPENPATGSVGELTRVAPKLNEPNGAAAFSPDGRYLAHFRGFGSTRIVIRELATGTGARNPVRSTVGSWSCEHPLVYEAIPSLRRAYAEAICGLSRQRERRIRRAPAHCPGRQLSPAMRRRMEKKSSTSPWTPFSAGSSLVRRSLASGRETTIAEFEGPVVALAGSSDGKHLAVIAVDPKGSMAHLVTMSVSGGNKSADLMTSRALLGGTRWYSVLNDVVWMPGGDRLLVFRGDDGDLNAFLRTSPGLPTQFRIGIWEVPLTGDAPRQFGFLPLPKVQGTFLRGKKLHHASRREALAFQSHEGFVEQTWAMDNLFQFIKAGGGW